MDQKFHRAVNQLRAIVFGYSLFFEGGFQSRNDYAHWCDCWWLSRHPSTPVGPKPNSKWFAMLSGRWLRCASELMEDFPLLASVASDPLWSVLEWESGEFDLAEAFIRRVRVNGKAVLPFSNEAMETLCGCPDWRRLAFLVALLRTRQPQYLCHRLWLQKNFSCYVQLVCLLPPCCACCSELYRLLHTLHLFDRLSAVNDWPPSLVDFHIALENQESQWDTLAAMNWLGEHDAFDVTMLWYVAKTHRLLVPRFARGQYDCPLELSRRVQDCLFIHAKTRITLVD